MPNAKFYAKLLTKELKTLDNMKLNFKESNFVMPKNKKKSHGQVVQLMINGLCNFGTFLKYHA